MLLRPADKINLAPPKYDEKSRFFTVGIHYGGKFNLGSIHAYVGGFVYKFDFYEFDMVVLEYFRKLVEHVGVQPPVRVFTNVNPDGFRLIQDDNELISICEEKLKTTREINLYFEEERLFCPYVPTEVSLRKMEEENDDIDGVEEEDEGEGNGAEVEDEGESEGAGDGVDEVENDTAGAGVDNDTDGAGVEDNGRSEWRQTGGVPLLPPIIGRPKKTRRREPDGPEEKQKKRSRGKEKVRENPHATRKMQRTVKCSLCGVSRHNKVACPSKNRSSNPPETEPAVESQDQPLSQLTQENAAERPSKSLARRKAHFAEDVAKGRPSISRKLKGKAPIQTTKNKSKLTLGNTSLQQCQVTTHSVNIRAPAPFVRGCYIQSIDKCVTHPCIAPKPIIFERGKKYVTMDNLAAALSQIKEAEFNNDKGKRPAK